MNRKKTKMLATATLVQVQAKANTMVQVAAPAVVKATRAGAMRMTIVTRQNQTTTPILVQTNGG